MKIASLEQWQEVSHFREHGTTHGDSEQVFAGTLAAISLPQPEAVPAPLDRGDGAQITCSGRRRGDINTSNLP